MIVDQKDLKEAAVIAASNPQAAGILIGGRHGTGKSVMARAIHQLLPKTIERVKGSLYNVDPSGQYGIDTFLLQDLIRNGSDINDLETEDFQTPFVHIPLNIMEDSLCGTVDIEQSMISGETVFSPGLLAKAHRGILYIDDIHLLDDNILSILFDVVSDGWVMIEREGMSVRYPCVPLVVATWNPEEGEITSHFTDRIAMSLSADVEILSKEERVEAAYNVINFSGGVEERDRSVYIEKERKAIEDDSKLRQIITSARNNLSNVEISSDQVLYICEETTRAGCDGQRGEIFATQIAKTCAAISGRTKVNAADLQTGVRLALVHRSKYFMDDTVSDDDSVEDHTNDMTPIEPPPGDQGGADAKESAPDETLGEDSSEQAQSMQEQQSENDEEKELNQENEEFMPIPEEFMFGVNMVPIDPKLLTFMERVKKGQGGKRSKQFNLERGRFCKAIFPQGGIKRGRIAVGATLRAAAPYQKLRRKMAEGTKKEGKVVYVDKNDFRIKKLTRKSGALIIFVVDASGSMALNRMDAAKGAAISLLSEAYKARDKICLVSFHHDHSEVIVPPTKSTALTKSRLEGMPCGGGSPLSHALTIASKVAINEKKIKKDVGKVIIVLLTDGRANVPLCVSMGEGFDPTLLPSIDGRPSKQFLRDEAISCAKIYRKLGLDLLVIDFEDKFVGTGIAQDIAYAAGGKYYQIDLQEKEEATQSITRITKQNI